MGAKRKTSEERKMLCAEKYGNLYDYSKSDFTISANDTIVTCPIHGDFRTSFDKHYNQGSKCQYCSYPSRDTKSFINEATRIHEGKYDYSKVKYINAHSKVTIICPIHGEFEQIPNAHLRGQGCPKCATNTVLENNVREVLDDLGFEYEFQKRFDFLSRGSHSKLSLDFFIPKLNLAIECQGKQHFGLGGWSKSYDHELQLERDRFKFDACIKNNIGIIYFAHKLYAPKEYFGKIFTSKSELLDFLKYL